MVDLITRAEYCLRKSKIQENSDANPFNTRLWLLDLSLAPKSQLALLDPIQNSAI